MGRYLSGIDGALFCDGTKLGRVSNWSFTGNVDALESTTLGDTARAYVSGVESYSGSCTVFLYEDDAGALQASALTGDVLRTTAKPHGLKHRLKLAVAGQTKERAIECDVVITAVQMQAAAGDVLTAAVDFVVTGNLIGAGLGVI
jgi:hypothetical protein